MQVPGRETSITKRNTIETIHHTSETILHYLGKKKNNPAFFKGLICKRNEEDNEKLDWPEKKWPISICTEGDWSP